MKIISTEDNKKHDVLIAVATPDDIKSISRIKNFNFNWLKPTGVTTLKLELKETGKILGLMSITDRSGDYAIEINMLESSKENVGKGKQYLNIAGCMIAYVCKESFRKGYNGYVCLKPKTELIKHYATIYGMKHTGLYMYVEGKDSYKIIIKYL